MAQAGSSAGPHLLKVRHLAWRRLRQLASRVHVKDGGIVRGKPAGGRLSRLCRRALSFREHQWQTCCARGRLLRTHGPTHWLPRAAARLQQQLSTSALLLQEPAAQHSKTVAHSSGGP